ncbi:MAG: hypothetical protein QXT63_08525 [Thermoplasmata archaeon]
MRSIIEEYERAKDIPDIFEVVKRAVRETIGKERSGLMLGLADLGGSKNYLVGAFYPIGTNIIVMNKTPLYRIKQTDPSLLKPYIFNILLHEYLHSLGLYDETNTQKKVQQISMRVFGKKHIVAEIATDIKKYVPFMVHPMNIWKPSKEQKIEIVQGFDKGNCVYIA